MVPLAYLSQFTDCQFTYGYIGSEDLTDVPDSSSRELCAGG